MFPKFGSEPSRLSAGPCVWYEPNWLAQRRRTGGDSSAVGLPHLHCGQTPAKNTAALTGGTVKKSLIAVAAIVGVGAIGVAAAAVASAAGQSDQERYDACQDVFTEYGTISANMAEAMQRWSENPDSSAVAVTDFRGLDDDLMALDMGACDDVSPAVIESIGASLMAVGNMESAASHAALREGPAAAADLDEAILWLDRVDDLRPSVSAQMLAAVPQE